MNSLFPEAISSCTQALSIYLPLFRFCNKSGRNCLCAGRAYPSIHSFIPAIGILFVLPQPYPALPSDQTTRTRQDKNNTSVIVESGQGSMSNPTWRALPRPGWSQQPAARSRCLFSIPPTATARLCLLIPRQATVPVGSPKCRHRSREALPHD